MTDTSIDIETANLKRKLQLVRMIILTGWVLTLLMMFAVIGAAVYLTIAHPESPVPKTLETWATMAFGFLFGGFSSIIKEYISQ